MGLDRFLHLVILLVMLVALAACGTTKRMMKNCEHRVGEFFECEEP